MSTPLNPQNPVNLGNPANPANPGVAGGAANPATRPGGQPGILTLNIKDKNALYASYMPFVKNGGLFIPTSKEYRIGDEVFILLTLMENPERLPVAGKVVWVTPRAAQGKRAQGIGVQFSTQDAGETQKKIESLLAGTLNSDRPTHTM